MERCCSLPLSIPTPVVSRSAGAISPVAATRRSTPFIEAATREKVCTPCRQPPTNMQRPRTRSVLPSTLPGNRGAHDLQQARLEREARDHQFRDVAEGGIEDAGDARPGGRAEFVRRHADAVGEDGERAAADREDEHIRQPERPPEDRQQREHDDERAEHAVSPPDMERESREPCRCRCRLLGLHGAQSIASSGFEVREFGVRC